MTGLYYPMGAIHKAYQRAPGDPWADRCFFATAPMKRGIIPVAHDALDGERHTYPTTIDPLEVWYANALSQLRDVVIAASLCRDQPIGAEYLCVARELLGTALTHLPEWMISNASGAFATIQLAVVTCRLAAVMCMLEDFDEFDCRPAVPAVERLAEELMLRMERQPAHAGGLMARLRSTGWALGIIDRVSDCMATYIDAGLVAAARALSTRGSKEYRRYLAFACGSDKANPFPMSSQITLAPMVIVNGPHGPGSYVPDEALAAVCVDGHTPGQAPLTYATAHLQAMEACVMGLISIYGYVANVCAMMLQVAPVAVEYVGRVVSGVEPPSGATWKYENPRPKERSLCAGACGSMFRLTGDLEKKFLTFQIDGELRPYPSNAPFYDVGLHGWAMSACA